MSALNDFEYTTETDDGRGCRKHNTDAAIGRVMTVKRDPSRNTELLRNAGHRYDTI
jgi:hypothetical protein